MSTILFGHPEVYICAPSNCLISSLSLLYGNFFTYNCIKEPSITHLIVFMNIGRSKAYDLMDNWKIVHKSDYKRVIRIVILSKKSSLAIIVMMHRFTNLLLLVGVKLHFSWKCLTGYILTHRIIECVSYGVFKLIQQLKERKKKQQGARTIYEFYTNSGFPNVRKDNGNGKIIAVEKVLKNIIDWRSLSCAIHFISFRCFCTPKDIFSYPAKGLSLLSNEVDPIITNKGDSKSTTISLTTNNNLIHKLSDLKRLILSYEAIKSKKDNQILDDRILGYLKDISFRLKAGKFEFTVNVTKPKIKKKEVCSQITASLHNKIVQKRITEVLNEIYEPLFLDYSHGYRPYKDCYTALKFVDRTFRKSNWVVSVDIKNCFDNIDHSKLLDIIQKQVKCNKTVVLIKKLLQSEFLYEGKYFKTFKTGVSQNSILSPLLSNIYLNELDIFMDLLIKNSKKEKKKIPVYIQALSLLTKALKEGNIIEILKIRHALYDMSSKGLNEINYVRVGYCRYASDIIVSVTGSFSLAKNILKIITDYLKDALKLSINLEKLKICSFYKPVKFLNVLINNSRVYDKPVKLLDYGKNKNKGKKVRTTARIYFHVPIRALIKKLVVCGYFKWTEKTKGKARPTVRKNLINLDHQIIILNYNSVINGLLNYYSFADNKKSLGGIVHGLKCSCALTLALKYKLRTAAKAYKKFKKDLADPESKTKLHISNIFSRQAYKDKFDKIRKSFKNKKTISDLGNIIHSVWKC